MSSVDDLITDLGGPQRLATTLGVNANAVRQWKSRGTIPPEYWPELIELAEQKKRPGVTWDFLRAARKAASKRAA